MCDFCRTCGRDITDDATPRIAALEAENTSLREQVNQLDSSLTCQVDSTRHIARSLELAEKEVVAMRERAAEAEKRRKSDLVEVFRENDREFRAAMVDIEREHQAHAATRAALEHERKEHQASIEYHRHFTDAIDAALGQPRDLVPGPLLDNLLTRIGQLYGVRCAYCDSVVQDGRQTEHVEQCEKHPLYATRAALGQAIDAIKTLNRQMGIEEVWGIGHCHHCLVCHGTGSDEANISHGNDCPLADVVAQMASDHPEAARRVVERMEDNHG